MNKLTDILDEAELQEVKVFMLELIAQAEDTNLPLTNLKKWVKEL